MARGVLELLWDSCYDSGEDYVGTADDIETMVAWAGERGALAAALVDAGAPEGHGFIEAIDEGHGRPVRFRVHDLWHHAPDYVAKRRRRELDRLAKVDPASERRESERRTAPDGGQCPRSSDWQNGVPPPPSPSPPPSPPPVEKSVSSTPLPAREPAVLVFPTIGTGGNEWDLTASQIAEWLELFPGIDVSLEVRKALAWIKASPGRRKTASGMKRFLVGWLTRSVNNRTASPTSPVRRLSVIPIEPSQPSGVGVWVEECRRLHNGECQGSLSRHRERMAQAS